MVHLGTDVSPKSDIQCGPLSDQDKQRIAGRKWAEEMIEFAKKEGASFHLGFIREIKRRFVVDSTQQVAMDEAEAARFEKEEVQFGKYRNMTFGETPAEYLAWYVDINRPIGRYVRSRRFKERQEREQATSMLQQFLNEAKTEKPVAKSIEPPPQAITYKGVPIVFDPHIGANEAVIVPAEPAEVLEEIDPPPPCPRCGSLELWESPTRPAGHRWRCRRCDPPHRAEAWARKAARLREEKELRSKQQY